MNLEVFNKIEEFWLSISDKIRFLIVGGFNASVSYLIYFLVCLIIGENFYQISLACAWILSSIVSFNTQKYLVFKIEGNPIRQYFKCCLTWFFSYLINASLLEIFVQKLDINVYLSQILATFFCAIFTYISFKVYAFRREA
ncbi:GtrA family protein [bacterium]|nr:GtrA family protein [bacterium]